MLNALVSSFFVLFVRFVVQYLNSSWINGILRITFRTSY
jgi:hypothetical protein